jgi:hypothetical protein
MNLNDLLKEKRSRIIKKWCDTVLSTYPEQSQKFLRKQKDAIANPVGRTIFEGIESIYDELLGEADSNKISVFLNNIIQVRAVQDFSPSRAVGFIFGLKKAIKEELETEILQDDTSKEWAAFEDRLDGMTLLCFDVYSECRQKLFDIRVNELRNQSHRLLKMAGLAYELPENYEAPGKGEELKEDEVVNGSL